MITKNEVYTKLTEYSNTMKEMYCTQFYEVVPQSFPCLYFRERHAPKANNITLKMTDRQMIMTVFIELYGKNLDKYVTEIESAMRSMMFIENFCDNIANEDPSIERISMRFSRAIGEADTLEGE